jgi:hypothetical protein
MSYQKPEIWKEKEFTKDGRSWTSELAKYDEVEAVYPELASHLQRTNGFKHDDGIYTYSVSVKPGYDPTVFRKPSYKRQNYLDQKRGGGQSRPQSQVSQGQQKSLSDTDVKYEELAAKTEKWMQNIDFKLDRLLSENNIDPAGIKPASSLREDHGNEMGGDNAAGTGIDTLNSVIEKDGETAFLQTPTVEVPPEDIPLDAGIGQESDQ